MQTVILPGYSADNKEWTDLVAAKLRIEGFIRPMFWDHWYNPEEKFYPVEKASLIYRHAKGDMMNIIAKSIGTLVASYIIKDVPEQINKVIICGIPLNDISEEEKQTIKDCLASLEPSRLICFQNESDPHGTFAEVKAFLPAGINLISKPRSDHEYSYYDEFNEFLAS